MQIAGKICDVCQSKIFGILDGRGCRKCNLGYHADCIPDGVICPHCKDNLDLQAVEHKAELKINEAEMIRNGRNHFVISMILTTMPIFAATLYMGMLSDVQPMLKARAWIAFGGWLGLLVWVWSGSPVARIINGLFIIASFTLLVLMTVKNIGAGAILESLVFSVASIFMLAAGVMMFFKPSISHYLDSQNHTPNS